MGQKYTEAPRKNRACHGWSGYNGIRGMSGFCFYKLYTGSGQKPFIYRTAATAVTVTGWLFYFFRTEVYTLKNEQLGH